MKDLLNRDEIIKRYAELCVENMDLDALCIFAEEQIAQNIEETYEDNDIREVVNNYYPEIWEEFPQE